MERDNIKKLDMYQFVQDLEDTIKIECVHKHGEDGKYPGLSGVLSSILVSILNKVLVYNPELANQILDDMIQRRPNLEKKFRGI